MGKCTAQGIQLVQGMSLEFVYHLSVAFFKNDSWGKNFTYVVLIEFSGVLCLGYLSS